MTTRVRGWGMGWPGHLHPAAYLSEDSRHLGHTTDRRAEGAAPQLWKEAHAVSQASSEVAAPS